MKKYVVCSFLVHACVSFSLAQLPSFKGPQVYAELEGGSIGLGIHVEHLLFNYRAMYVTGRVGIGGLSKDGFSPCVPVSIHSFFLKGNHHPEIGAGLSYLSLQQEPPYTEDIRVLQFFPVVAYRYQRPGGGVFFKVSWTPIITVKQLDDNETLGRSESSWIGAGLAVGYYFAR